jgi:putative serine protease PepD
VAQVAAGSAAAEAGIQAGDLIIGVNADPVHTVTDLRKFLNFVRVGEVVTLTLDRDGQTAKVKVTIGSSPSLRSQGRTWD